MSGNGISQRDEYDADGLRVVRNGSSHTIFASTLFEFNTISTGTKHIFAGSQHVASTVSTFVSGQNPAPPTAAGTPYFVHLNHLGSVAVVTTAGSIHNPRPVNDAHEYFPDGAAWVDSGRSSSIDGHLFSGKPFDTDTGFYDFGQRFYDPRTSMWLGMDQVLKASPVRATTDSSVLSGVLYVSNNPIRFTDPDGRDKTLEEQANRVSYPDATCSGGNVEWEQYNGEYYETLPNVAPYGGADVRIQSAGLARLNAQGRTPTEGFRAAEAEIKESVEFSAGARKLLGFGLILAAPELFGEAGFGMAEEGAAAELAAAAELRAGSLTGAITRLRPDEISTGQRLAQQLGIDLVESPHVGAEFIDPQLGTSYDAMGMPRASQYWNEGEFTDSIRRHVVQKPDNITAVDLTGFTDAQKEVVRAYVDSLPASMQQRIIRIGF